MLRMCTRSTTRLTARTNDAKMVRSRDAQCNTEESPKSFVEFTNDFDLHE